MKVETILVVVPKNFVYTRSSFVPLRTIIMKNQNICSVSEGVNEEFHDDDNDD